MMPDPSQLRIQANMVIRNIGQLVTVAQQPVAGASGSLQIIANAAVALHDGVIVWLGRDDESEPMFQHDVDTSVSEITSIDAQGMVVTPGLVDSHTHLVFAGNRAEEFHLRRQGVSYGTLLAQGLSLIH